MKCPERAFLSDKRWLIGYFCRLMETPADSHFHETIGASGVLLVFGKVEGILIIPLEKWKFVHKLR